MTRFWTSHVLEPTYMTDAAALGIPAQQHNLHQTRRQAPVAAALVVAVDVTRSRDTARLLKIAEGLSAVVCVR